MWPTLHGTSRGLFRDNLWTSLIGCATQFESGKFFNVNLIILLLDSKCQQTNCFGARTRVNKSSREPSDKFRTARLISFYWNEIETISIENEKLACLKSKHTNLQFNLCSMRVRRCRIRYVWMRIIIFIAFLLLPRSFLFAVVALKSFGLI